MQGTVDYLSQAIFDTIYPVGSIYISVGSSLPSTFKGTWEKLATGRSLWNVTDNSQLGNDISGSLPNIIGTFSGAGEAADSDRGIHSVATGAFSISEYNAGPRVANDGDRDDIFAFNASRSNSVYSAAAGTSVVRPTSIGVMMWKRTA